MQMLLEARTVAQPTRRRV